MKSDRAVIDDNKLDYPKDEIHEIEPTESEQGLTDKSNLNHSENIRLLLEQTQDELEQTQVKLKKAKEEVECLKQDKEVAEMVEANKNEQPGFISNFQESVALKMLNTYEQATPGNKRVLEKLWGGYVNEDA